MVIFDKDNGANAIIANAASSFLNNAFDKE